MPSSRRAAAEGLDAAAIEEARDADEPKVACFPMGNGCFVTIDFALWWTDHTRLTILNGYLVSIYFSGLTARESLLPTVAW